MRRETDGLYQEGATIVPAHLLGPVGIALVESLDVAGKGSTSPVDASARREYAAPYISTV